MHTFANVLWGARCGKSARRVLLGETRSRGYAYSVRCRRESVPWREAPHGLPLSRLVSTIRFDLWAERWRHRHARGRVLYVRYADDLVAGFEYEEDAQRFLAQLRARLEEFALKLHPEKTRLIQFGRFAASNRVERGLPKPETFNFLGFTHICGHSRGGRFLLKRKTCRKRMCAKLKALKGELRRRMHAPIPKQGRWLAQVLRGYFGYFAVPTNYPQMSAFHHQVKELWHRTLRRRSQRDKTPWERTCRLAAAFLPTPRVLHPWPEARFLVNHPRWEPSALIGPARICAGGAR